MMMTTAPLPTEEASRLAALYRLQLLDTPPEERFEALTRTAQRLFQVPIVSLNLVDRARVWAKSNQGLEVCEFPRQDTFCAYTILHDEVLILPDTRQDDRFARLPVVTAPQPVRFYAGVPLHSRDGQRVATLCLMDYQPRQFGPQDLAGLQDLVVWAENELNSMQLEELNQRLQTRENQLQATLEALTQSEERNQSLIAALEEGIVLQHRDGTIVTANVSAERILGLPFDQLAGRTSLDPRWRAVHEDGSPFPGDAHPAMVSLRTGQPFSNVVMGVYKPDGSLGWISINSQPLFGRDSNEKLPYAVVCSFSDITERKQNEEILREREARYRAFVEAIPDMMFRLGADGSFIDYKFDNVDELLEPPERFMGRTIRQVLPAHLLALTEHHLQQVFATGQPQLYDFELVLQNGVLHNYEARMVRSGENEALVIVRDITERKKIERLKTEFVSIVSHELRTPLTSIRGSLSLVVGGVAGEVSPEVRSMLEIAQKNSERLISLINDILDIDKIESGSMRFDFQPLELNQLLPQSLEANQGYAEQYGVKFELKIAPELNGPQNSLVQGDSARLMQVMANLLSNAAKFSPAGSTVSVSLDLTPCGWLQIAVSDRGAGIPESFRSQIFQKFAQADSSATRAKGGSGLGLSVAKAIVEKHAGQIRFETATGQGTTGTSFYICLPRLEAQEQAETTTGNAPVEPWPGRPRLLYVEDNTDLVAVLKLLLKEVAEVVYAPGLAPARQQLSQAGPGFDLVIVDVNLPDGNGLDLLPELAGYKTKQNGGPLPVVLFSAQELSLDTNQPVAAVLTKTRTSNLELVNTVRRLLGLPAVTS